MRRGVEGTQDSLSLTAYTDICAVHRLHAYSLLEAHIPSCNSLQCAYAFCPSRQCALRSKQVVSPLHEWLLPLSASHVSVCCVQACRPLGQPAWPWPSCLASYIPFRATCCASARRSWPSRQSIRICWRSRFVCIRCTVTRVLTMLCRVRRTRSVAPRSTCPRRLLPWSQLCW